MLPKDFSNFPLLYSEEDLKLLEGSIMTYSIELWQGQIDDIYQLLQKHAPEFTAKYS